MAIGIQDQYFGTEIEMTGITRQRAAEVVAEMFGTRAVCDGGYYGVWSVTDQEGKKWKFMYDGSIYTERRERGRMVRAGSEYSTEWSVRNFPMEKWESCRKWYGVSGIMGRR